MNLNLTTQELVILLILIIGLGILFGFLFKSAIKIIIGIVLIMVIWAVGFKWLPEQVDRITNGEATINDVAGEVINDFNESGIPESVGNTLNNVGEYVDEHKDSWIDSFFSLIDKLTGNYEEDPPVVEVPEQ